MFFYNDLFILVEDSFNNIYMFQWKDRCINLFLFNYLTEEVKKQTIVKDASKEFDVSIDDSNNIYMVYQDINNNLILIILDGKSRERAKLTYKPGSIIYNLNILNDKDNIHIFYCIESEKSVGRYKIYHNLFDGENWLAENIGEINTFKILNPLQFIKKENSIFMVYYNYLDKKEIYLKCYNIKERIWEEEIKLTRSSRFKLYLDFIVIENKLNLVYSEETDGNFVIKYERFSLENSVVKREIEEIISNPENSSHPTIVYYGEKVWIIWLEYNNLLSRYSDDRGKSWSPIYLWKGFRNKNIIKYKYINNREKNNNILNSSFGEMYPEVSFIGFGPLDNVIEIPLKKKIKII